MVIPDSVRTPPTESFRAERPQLCSRVFLNPNVLDDAFPAVKTKVSSATSFHAGGGASWATSPLEAGNSARAPATAIVLILQLGTIESNLVLFPVGLEDYSMATL
jgi:hypothetical protein